MWQWQVPLYDSTSVSLSEFRAVNRYIYLPWFTKKTLKWNVVFSFPLRQSKCLPDMHHFPLIWWDLNQVAAAVLVGYASTGLKSSWRSPGISRHSRTDAGFWLAWGETLMKVRLSSSSSRGNTRTGFTERKGSLWGRKGDADSAAGDSTRQSLHRSFEPNVFVCLPQQFHTLLWVYLDSSLT